MELPLLDGDWFSLVTRQYILFIYVGIWTGTDAEIFFFPYESEFTLLIYTVKYFAHVEYSKWGPAACRCCANTVGDAMKSIMLFLSWLESGYNVSVNNKNLKVVSKSDPV